MQTAYQYLFDLENTLRLTAKKRLEQLYGPRWQDTVRGLSRRSGNDLDKLSFFDLVTWFHTIPSLQHIYPEESISQLFSIVPIRNKIAHCEMLTKGEFKDLKSVYELIMLQTPTGLRYSRRSSTTRYSPSSL